MFEGLDQQENIVRGRFGCQPYVTGDNGNSKTRSDKTITHKYGF